MQRIFLSPDQFKNGTARITGGDHLHLTRVLRAKPGEKLILLDGQGKAYNAYVQSIEKSESVAQIECEIPILAEPKVHISVAQALIKGDKFDEVIQHGVEAGASSFVPIRADRSIVEIPDVKILDRVARWQQIAKSAAEQSGRGTIPKVFSPINIIELINNLSSNESIFLLHPHPPNIELKALITEMEAPSRIVMIIGPEGGWSEREVQSAISAGANIVSIGPRILRTETAALIAVSQLLYQWES